MIPVSEVFYSIQGEGKYAGHPAIFVRVGGCNLTCPNFGPHGCDSYHSVNAKEYRHEWSTLETKELVQLIEQTLPVYAASKDKPVIIFTGGEPTLYQAHLDPVVTYFITRNYKVQFETNASITIDFEKYPIYKQVSFAMSVKLANSGEPEHKRLNVPNIENILKYTELSFFKFVVKSEKDIEEVNSLLSEIYYYSEVFLMPMGETKKQLNQTAKLVFEACMQYGFKYSDRLHIRIYDDQRGV